MASGREGKSKAAATRAWPAHSANALSHGIHGSDVATEVPDEGRYHIAVWLPELEVLDSGRGGAPPPTARVFHW